MFTHEAFTLVPLNMMSNDANDDDDDDLNYVDIVKNAAPAQAFASKIAANISCAMEGLDCAIALRGGEGRMVPSDVNVLGETIATNLARAVATDDMANYDDLREVFGSGTGMAYAGAILDSNVLRDSYGKRMQNNRLNNNNRFLGKKSNKAVIVPPATITSNAIGSFAASSTAVSSSKKSSNAAQITPARKSFSQRHQIPNSVSSIGNAMNLGVYKADEMWSGINGITSPNGNEIPIRVPTSNFGQYVEEQRKRARHRQRSQITKNVVDHQSVSNENKRSKYVMMEDSTLVREDSLTDNGDTIDLCSPQKERTVTSRKVGTPPSLELVNKLKRRLITNTLPCINVDTNEELGTKETCSPTASKDLEHFYDFGKRFDENFCREVAREALNKNLFADSNDLYKTLNFVRRFPHVTKYGRTPFDSNKENRANNENRGKLKDPNNY